MRLYERALIVVCAITIVVTLFYGVGNFQNFTDRTQSQLLMMMQTAGGIAFVGTVIALILELIQLIVFRNLSSLGVIVLLLLGGVIILGITVGSSGLLVFLGPV